MEDKFVILTNGCKLPKLCYGTGVVLTYRDGNHTFLSLAKYIVKNVLMNRRQIKNDFNFKKVIQVSMKNGCTMFDTSRAYGGSEFLLGKALAKYDREQFFVVTKIKNGDQYSGKVEDALNKSLSELNLSYVDLYLMHWPVEGHYLETWKKMEQLYKAGKCKAIGVCNCNIHHLEAIRQIAEIQPMVNQVECHPLFTQNELREYCKEKNIKIMAYTSTARMDERLRKTILKPIAKKYGKTMTQVILRWHQQIGNIPIVNTFNKNHIVENTRIDDFVLSDDEVSAITAVNINSRLRYDPDNCDFRQL